MKDNMIQKKIVRRKEVLSQTGLCNSTLYYFVDKGLFPSPYKLGKRTVAWKQNEIDEWIDNLQPSLKQESNHAEQEINHADEE